MVIHDNASNLSKKLKIISNCGYTLINHFLLPEDAWWKEYYYPLENHVSDLQKKYKNNKKILKILDEPQKEIDMVKNNLKAYTSGFFIIKRN
jgi:hypothetical protein